MLDTRYRTLLEVSEGTSHYSDSSFADLMKIQIWFQYCLIYWYSASMAELCRSS